LNFDKNYKKIKQERQIIDKSISWVFKRNNLQLSKKNSKGEWGFGFYFDSFIISL